MSTRNATCACGQLAVTCSQEPNLVALCHCLACKKRTGSAYGIAAFFAKDAVAISGNSHQFVRQADSGFAVTFHFCPTCGSTVFWVAARRPDDIAVAAGAFADPDFPAPAKEVYTDHRNVWLAP